MGREKEKKLSVLLLHCNNTISKQIASIDLMWIECCIALSVHVQLL